jgi:S1 RNA binding domain protein
MIKEFKIGEIVEAEVTKVTDFGAFVKINGQGPGLIHISQISDSFVKDINQYLKVGDKVKARVIKLGPGRKVDLSLKRFPAASAQKDNSGFKSSDFEEKLKKFLRQSQRSLTDLKKHNEEYYR